MNFQVTVKILTKFYADFHVWLIYRQASSSPRRLVVGNIHVLFNPKRGDIKLGQVCLASSLQNSENIGLSIESVEHCCHYTS